MTWREKTLKDLRTSRTFNSISAVIWLIVVGLGAGSTANSFNGGHVDSLRFAIAVVAALLFFCAFGIALLSNWQVFVLERDEYLRSKTVENSDQLRPLPRSILSD